MMGRMPFLARSRAPRRRIGALGMPPYRVPFGGMPPFRRGVAAPLAFQGRFLRRRTEIPDLFCGEPPLACFCHIVFSLFFRGIARHQRNDFRGIRNFCFHR